MNWVPTFQRKGLHSQLMAFPIAQLTVESVESAASAKTVHWWKDHHQHGCCLSRLTLTCVCMWNLDCSKYSILAAKYGTSCTRIEQSSWLVLKRVAYRCSGSCWVPLTCTLRFGGCSCGIGQRNPFSASPKAQGQKIIGRWPLRSRVSKQLTYITCQY